jgi:ABC-type methionine transport system ATPase subunit
MGIETLRVRLNFSETLIKEPLIFKASSLFKISPSILKADVQAEGWVLLDLSGAEYELEGALTWLKNQGVNIKSVRVLKEMYQW